MAVRLGIDMDGAFTDPIGINDVTRELVVAKTPSTLSRPVDLYDDYTIKRMQEARVIHDALFNALGVTFKERVQELQGADHVMATHRMGSDSSTSVTNADGRTHDHPNLFLAGDKLFPTFGEANPTLTIAALALRTAATIETELGVKGGIPVRSPAA
jgi:choline dehydrogenase-like flavoprotein